MASIPSKRRAVASFRPYWTGKSHAEAGPLTENFMKPHESSFSVTKEKHWECSLVKTAGGCALRDENLFMNYHPTQVRCMHRSHIRAACIGRPC